MKMESKRKEKYWASLPKDEFLDEAQARIQEYYDDLESTGLFWLMETSYRAYYGANLTGGRAGGELFDSATLKRGGKNGELTHLKTNHYKNLIDHSLQLVTSQKAAISCRATNTDSKSQTQTILGRGVVDYYMTEKKVGRRRAGAIKKGLIFGEGWVHAPWNATKGEIYDRHPETGAPIYNGDLDFYTKTPLDVVRDISLSDDDEHDWLFVRDSVNKFDLAAKYTDLADDILSESPEAKYEAMESFRFEVRKSGIPDSDRITRWTMYHRKTDAMPQGRLVIFISNKILFDGPTPYRSIPVKRFTPSNLEGTPYGYSPAFDLLGPQQGLDILSSTIMSNNATNGVQSLWSKRNDNISVTTLGGGMKNIQSDTKPEPLQLTQTAPETFNFRTAIIGEMETIMGISATVRGNPEASLKSGNSLALVVSQSLQFASLIEEAANGLLEDLGTEIILQIQDFGNTPRIANIIGQASRPYQKEFSGKDISQIARVVVEQVNPLSKTISGRVQIAESLLEKGMIKSAQQYIMVLTTGQIDSALEGTQHAELNLKAENEEMQNGRPVTAIITDNHADHIREHKALLENPEARRNGEFVKMVLAHNQKHLDLWRSADPALLLVTGQNPPPPPMNSLGQPTGPQPQQGAGGPPMLPGNQPAPSEMQAPGNPIMNEQPSMPSMPKVPANAPPQAQEALDKQQQPQQAM